MVAYNNHGKAIGCGAFKEYSKDTIEIKRMFVSVEERGKGIATMLLNELELWGIALGFTTCVLETLKEKEYAIRFYKKNNYQQIANFGPYIAEQKSICFEKKVNV